MNRKELQRIGQVLNCGGTGGTPGPCPSGDYESPTLKKNKEVVARLNNPTTKKLTPKQAKEKEARFLQDKLGQMSDLQVGEIAKKHGIDPTLYPSRFNLHSTILRVPAAKSELLGQ